jgi:hypothetical protein
LARVGDRERNVYEKVLGGYGWLKKRRSGNGEVGDTMSLGMGLEG